MSQTKFTTGVTLCQDTCQYWLTTGSQCWHQYCHIISGMITLYLCWHSYWPSTDIPAMAKNRHSSTGQVMTVNTGYVQIVMTFSNVIILPVTARIVLTRPIAMVEHCFPPKLDFLFLNL